MPANADQVLPVLRVAEIPSDEIAERWLVEELWCTNSVGVIGGAPKCAKTWLSLDMALSVATGTSCLGKYAVPEPGPVLVYLAEDALVAVRERIEGMAWHRGLDLDRVEVHVITAPVLRLDQERDRMRLWETTRRLRPRLLVLDPLVRLHGIDENRAGDVAELLAYFRSLQRELGLSVVLVHHTRKNAADGVAAGQGLRGSGDIHAFGDSNLYLQRAKDHLILSSEHRAARASAPVYLELVAVDVRTAHLVVIADFGELSRAERPNEMDRGLHERLLALLAGGEVLTRTSLRESLGVKNERLGEVLESLERAGQISHTPKGWQRCR
jgi:RecA-family ATPase